MADTPGNPLCPQCGYYHPPLREGQDCPMAAKKDDQGNDIELGEELSKIKSILISNIQNKKVKNYKKFVNRIILELNKKIEELAEEDW